MTEIKGIDGTVRQDYYGPGRQPWDDIKDLGWGPQFAAGNVLKYLRRPSKSASNEMAKAIQLREDLKKARWYWNELRSLTDGQGNSVNYNVLDNLWHMLTEVEKKMLLDGSK